MIRHWWQSAFLLFVLFAVAACNGAAPDAESTSVEVPSATPIPPTSSPEPSSTPPPTYTQPSPTPRMIEIVSLDNTPLSPEQAAQLSSLFQRLVDNQALSGDSSHRGVELNGALWIEDADKNNPRSNLDYGSDASNLTMIVVDETLDDGYYILRLSEINDDLENHGLGRDAVDFNISAEGKPQGVDAHGNALATRHSFEKADGTQVAVFVPEGAVVSASGYEYDGNQHEFDATTGEFAKKPVEIPIPSEVDQLLQGTGYEAVSTGSVEQQNGEAQAYFDKDGHMVAVMNLSTRELERTRFNVNGTEVFVFPNTKSTIIRTEEEAVELLNGQNISIKDATTYTPEYEVYWGGAELDPISITRVDMEQWRIVQSDADEYTFPVARVHFTYLENGVVKKGLFFMRNTTIYRGRLDIAVDLISVSSWSSINVLGLEFMTNEHDLSLYETMYNDSEIGGWIGETTVAAWSVMNVGNLPDLQSKTSDGSLSLGSPGSSYVPTKIRGYE